MTKEKKLQGKAELKLLEFLGKYGPSHMYPFHEVKSDCYIAARSTIHRAKDSLFNKELIYEKEIEEHSGKDKRIFALTFRGMHYALKHHLASYKNIKDIMKKHEIDVPEISEEDVDKIINHFSKTMVPSIVPVNAFYGPFFVAMGGEGARNLIRFAIDKYPKDFFEIVAAGVYRGYSMNPLWPRVEYLRNLFGKAILVVFPASNTDPNFSRSEFIDAIGEDAYRMVELLGQKMKRLPTDEKEYLKQVSPERRKRIAKRLRGTR